MMKRVLLILILVTLISSSILPVLAGEVDYQTEADIETLYDYKTALMDELPSTRHSGRVWTDKTVFDNKQNSVKIDNHTFNYEDDFLEVYSALGSNFGVGETKDKPIDLVLIIDCSESMGLLVSGQEENTERPILLIDKMAEALNMLIDKVMAQNAQNRIAIVAFQGTADTIFPLGRYSKVNDKDYLTVEYVKDATLMNSAETFLLTFEGQNESGEISRKISNNSGSQEYKNYSLGSFTNLQDGYQEGLEILANNEVSDKGTRRAKIVTLSDGFPTLFSTGSFYEDSKVGESLGIPEDTDHWIEAAALQTILTTAYYKAAIEKNYGTPAQINFLWTRNEGGEEEETLRYFNLILNTTDYLNGSKKTDDKVAQQIIEDFKGWKENKNISVTVTKDDDFQSIVNISKFPDTNDYGISKDDLINNTNIIDYFEEVPISEEFQFLKDLVESFNFSEFHPLETENAENDTNQLVYEEPIGEYLQVLPKKLLVFDQEYEFTKINEANTDTTRTEVFSPVSSNGDQIVKNTTYTNPVDSNLSDIKFIIETTGTKQNLIIKIPEGILPVINTTVLYTQHYDDNNHRIINSVTDNRNSVDARPIRFIYGVNLISTVRNADGTVNLNNISDDYKAIHYIDKNINFNTTDYQDNKASYNDKLSIGEAQSKFTPSHDNPYYRAQTDLVVYKDKGLKLPLLKSDKIDENSDYYISKEYYVKEESGAKLARETNSIKGSVIENGQASVKSSDDSISILPDTNCIGDLHEFSVQKEDNKTNTASLAYYPVIDDVQNNPDVLVHTLLGNNGKMALTVSFDININITKYQAIGENSLTKDRLTVSASDIITYQLDINNDGNILVENVLITDKLPIGLKIVPNSISHDGIFLIDTLTWVIDIPAKTTVSLHYQVWVPDVKQAVYKNFFTLEYESNNKSIKKDSNIVEAVQGSPNIQLVKYQGVNENAKTKEKQTVSSGDQLTYFFEVTNTGTSRAKNVKVTDNIPNDLILQENSISDGGYLNNNQVTWILDHLEPNETRLISFVVTIPTLSTHYYWRNIAYATHQDDPTPIPSNEVEIEKPQGSLSINKMQSTQSIPSPTTDILSVNANEIVTYFLNITNTNIVESITNITVSDQVPDGLRIINESISNYGTVENNKITWFISELGPGQSIQVNFQAQVPENQQASRWDNFATLNSPEIPNSIQSNTVTITESVENSPTISNINNYTKNSTTTNSDTTNSVTEVDNNPKTGISESDFNAFIWLISLGCILLLTSQAIRNMK